MITFLPAILAFVKKLQICQKIVIYNIFCFCILEMRFIVLLIGGLFSHFLGLMILIFSYALALAVLGLWIYLMWCVMTNREPTLLRPLEDLARSFGLYL